ncbi:hypothetical protein QTI17_29745 [Variovorax sp. J31P179]|uniref:hypothetical protein n=1 Tax=Variovorax sp. J31P179 TaxID=3053508 RepID=UPI0025780856|nr:hypothetical protein [Variovorax sp. J31P179]MDM0084789.1 hypothetical protein [Variovorax sp. J31P179]
MISIAQLIEYRQHVEMPTADGRPPALSPLALGAAKKGARLPPLLMRPLTSREACSGFTSYTSSAARSGGNSMVGVEATVPVPLSCESQLHERPDADGTTAHFKPAFLCKPFAPRQGYVRPEKAAATAAALLWVDQSVDFAPGS